MTSQPQQPNPMQNNYYPDDEIELIDYLRVLWKWKWLIVLITFVCMLAAGVFSFMMPKIYKVSTAIEPGIIGMNKNSSPIYLDSAENIKAKIESGIYNSRILKRLNIDPQKTQLKFKAVNPKDTKLIKISSEWEQDKIVIGTEVLDQLVTELSHDYEKVVQANIEDFDKQVLLKLSGIQGKKNDIKLKEAIIKNIRERKSELVQEIKRAKNNTERLVQQRDRVLDGSTGDREDIALLLYFTTVQQNVAYFNQLNNQLNKLTSKENEITTEVEQLKQNMNDINTEIDRLNIEKSYIENIKLISKPEVSTSPIKPKKELNIALAGVVGFMLAVFMAFFAEYIKKSKEKSTTQHQQ